MIRSEEFNDLQKMFKARFGYNKVKTKKHRFQTFFTEKEEEIIFRLNKLGLGSRFIAKVLDRKVSGIDWFLQQNQLESKATSKFYIKELEKVFIFLRKKSLEETAQILSLDEMWLKELLKICSECNFSLKF